jgi:hypothetical protein
MVWTLTGLHFKTMTIGSVIVLVKSDNIMITLTIVDHRPSNEVVPFLINSGYFNLIIVYKIVEQPAPLSYHHLRPSADNHQLIGI